MIWDLFFLVPTGRGLNLELMSADEHDEVYGWVLENQQDWPFRSKTTLGQPYRRAMTLRRLTAGGRSVDSLTPEEIKSTWLGPPTNDGRGIFFISHLGEIYPSGFIPISAGNVRKYSMVDVYRNSDLFTKIRDRAELQGKCGICPFNVICGGSRSRAYAMTGDMTAADPTCRFQPPLRMGEAKLVGRRPVEPENALDRFDHSKMAIDVRYVAKHCVTHLQPDAVPIIKLRVENTVIDL